MLNLCENLMNKYVAWTASVSVGFEVGVETFNEKIGDKPIVLRRSRLMQNEHQQRVLNHPFPHFARTEIERVREGERERERVNV